MFASPVERERCVDKTAPPIFLQNVLPEINLSVVERYQAAELLEEKGLLINVVKYDGYGYVRTGFNRDASDDFMLHPHLQYALVKYRFENFPDAISPEDWLEECVPDAIDPFYFEQMFGKFNVEVFARDYMQLNCGGNKTESERIPYQRDALVNLISQSDAKLTVA